MTRIVRATGLAAVLAVALVAVTAAQGPQGNPPGMGPGGPGMRGGMGMGPGRGGNPMALLKLTTEQQTKIREIQEKHRAAMQQKMEAVRGLRDQLKAALYGDSAEKVAQIAGEIAQAELQMTPSRAAMQFEMIQVLDADQKKIAMEHDLFAGDGPGGFGGPMGPGPRGGRGGVPPARK